MRALSFGSLVRMTSWNVGGLALPLLAGALCIPPMLSDLGIERFGLLTLIWTLIGYCSLFDFGLGRALTQYLAGNRGSQGQAEMSAMVLSALAMFGCGGAFVVAGTAYILPPSLLGLSGIVASEMQTAVLLTALALPFVTLTSGLRGVLEANLDFARLSSLRAALGILTFVGPWLVSRFTPSLALVVVPIVAARILSTLAHAHMARVRMLELLCLRWPSFSALSPLLRMGGWLTVSNILSPLMVSLDRFVVAAMLSASMVVYYSTPQEVVARLLIVPSAFLGVWFPALCHASAESSEHSKALLLKGVAVVGAVVMPVAVLIGCFAHPVLQYWLGAEFAAQSHRVLSILSVGFAVNAVAHIPLAVLYAARRSHVPALFHLCELPAYVVLIVILTKSFGVEGAALAWTTRVAVDATLLFGAALRSNDAHPLRGGRACVDAADGAPAV